MTIKSSSSSANSPQNVIFENPERRSADSYERELIRRRATEVKLDKRSPGKKLYFLKKKNYFNDRRSSARNPIIGC